jgi:hypothetical protein
MAIAATRLPLQVRAWLNAVVSRLAQKHGGHWPGGTTANTLSRRSGSLVESLRRGVEVAGAGFATIGTLSGGEYAAVHEFGGTLRSAGGQYLAIPLPAALKADGTPIFEDPRQWRQTFVQRSKRGNLLVFLRKSSSDIVPLYVLKSSVTLPPRLGARNTAKEEMPYFVDKAVDVVMSSMKL